MRIGTFAYNTSRGLGHLAHDFYRHGLLTDVLVVRHPGVPANADWYPGAPEVPLRGIANHADTLCDFVRGKDAMLFFETPFHWPILDYCREIGVKTFLVTMHECHPKHRPEPYRYLCPSLLDMEYFGSNGTLVQLPVEYPWRLRAAAETFVHNGGYLGLKGSDGHNREGTTTLIEAMAHVTSPAKLILRCQENVPDKWRRMAEADPRIDYRPEAVPYADLYATGDVCVGAQKWNGCSLPLQEAFASGMLVMNTDRFPMNTWLPREPLIPVAGTTRHQIGGAYLEFEESLIDPKAIAAKIDAWYGKDVREFSRRGKAWSIQNSWEALLPAWKEALSS
mgnify:CR=1 FL=1